MKKSRGEDHWLPVQGCDFFLYFYLQIPATKGLRLQNVNMPFLVIRKVPGQGRHIEHILLNGFLVLFINFKYTDL